MSHMRTHFGIIVHEPPQCTEVRFASFLSGGFTNMAVIKSTVKETGKTHLIAAAHVP